MRYERLSATITRRSAAQGLGRSWACAGTVRFITLERGAKIGKVGR